MTNDKVDEANHMDTAINIGDVIKQFDEFLAKEKDAVAKLKALTRNVLTLTRFESSY